MWLILAKGIESLFPVQSMSFDAIYDGFDVIVQARKYCFVAQKLFTIIYYGEATHLENPEKSGNLKVVSEGHRSK